MINLDYTNVMNFITEEEINNSIEQYRQARAKVIDASGDGNEFLGWLNLPDKTDPGVIRDIMKTASEIRNEADIFICIGIGGSYLGARAAIETLLSNNYNLTGKPEIYFAGNSISSRNMTDLLNIMEGKNVYVNVISKSGTTTEPALAFRIIWDWMVENYGLEKATRQTIATTDAKRGALRKMADQLGMKTYIIPDDVGGRFSVLTPVGLLPIAIASINIEQMIEGARQGAREYRDREDLYTNPSSLYAVIRNLLYNKGKTTEILSNFEPQLHYISEWWKQLFGESEGKDGRGIFPASCDFTTDLHSMGQWIQEGQRNIFETFLHIDESDQDIEIRKNGENLDGLNFLAGKTLDYVNKQAFLGTSSAHKDGGVPNMTLNISKFSPASVGELFYFFEWAVAISGYMLNVNPFNQPGVELYKSNMFALLNKPGYENETSRIREKMAAEKKYISGISDKVRAGR